MSKQMDTIIHIKHLVGRATADALSGPDVAANTVVVDFINLQQDGFVVQHVLKAIKRRFRTNDMRVQLLSLNLLDACVANCGPVFHERLAGAELWRDMQEASVNTKKYSLAVQQKVLELVQAWANELQPATFRDVYRRLQKKKVRFPPPDRQRPPIAVSPPPVMGGRPVSAFPPVGSFPPNMGPPPPHSFSGTLGGPPGSTLPQRPRPPNRAAAIQEVQEAKNTASFLEDLLKEIQENDPASVTQEHVYDLAQQCLAFKFSMNDLASFETDESLLANAIVAHEELDRVVSKYTDMLSYSPSSAAPARQTNGDAAQAATTTVASSVPVSPISSATTPAVTPSNPTNLIDELLSLDMNDPVPAPGAAGQDPFLPQASIEGFPLQPPGPIQPGGLHEHGFGSDAFGANNAFGASAFAAPAAPAATAPSGNPFADEPIPAFAAVADAPGAYANGNQPVGGAFPEPSAVAPSSLFPMGGASQVAGPAVPPVAAAPPKPKGGYQSSPSYAASPAAGVHAAPAPVQPLGGGYPTLYGTAPTAANPFGGPPPAWSTQPPAGGVTAAARPQQAAPDPFDSLVSLR